MTALLVNQRIPTGQLIYDRRISRYRFARDSSPVDGQVIRDVLQDERSRLEGDLNRLSDQLIRGSIGVSTFQGSVGLAIKNSSINVTTFAAGGTDNLNRSAIRRQYYRQLGIGLEGVFGDVRTLTDRVASGGITEGQFRDRVRRFSLEVFPVYSKTEVLRMMSEQGFNEARRSVSVGIKHCPQCPNLSTGGNFIPIELIVPVGHRCYCGGRCYCRVDFRTNPQLPPMALNQIENFVTAMANRSLT